MVSDDSGCGSVGGRRGSDNGSDDHGDDDYAADLLSLIVGFHFIYRKNFLKNNI